MKEVHIYISGKIGNGEIPTADQMLAAQIKFNEAETYLKSLGFITINPLKLGITSKMNYEDIMDKCYKVIDEQADCMYMLPDWIDSFGAKREFFRAGKKSIPVYFSKADSSIIEMYAKHFYLLQEEEA